MSFPLHGASWSLNRRLDAVYVGHAIFRVGDHVRVSSQELADEWGFVGPLDGQIIVFSSNDGEPDAWLSGPTRGGRWIPLHALVLSPPEE